MEVTKIFWAMRQAWEAANAFRGATAPNPPVGAAALDAQGNLLGTAAHERAGTAHAEAKLLAQLEATGQVGKIHVLLITLEPCNHQGRTPPCTEAILRHRIPSVVYGTPDPNPRVAGGGAKRLQDAGIATTLIPQNSEEGRLCQMLIAPFAKWSRTAIPWVTVKTAYQSDSGSMIPPQGQKTFTSPESLLLAHQLRKRADALLTGSGTVLADRPQFTVRHTADHPDKRRAIAVLDRRGRVPTSWYEAAATRGFDPLLPSPTSFKDALQRLGALGCLEVLVEAGPRLTQSILDSGLWDEQVSIYAAAAGGSDSDRVEIRYNPAQ